MRLSSLIIGGFGGLPSGLKLKFGPGLNLVLAPNESGKTTLGDLISGLFYGYGKRKGGVHPYEPWSGAETGAELLYELDDGRSWSLSRHLYPRREEIIWRGADGQELDPDRLVPGEAHLGQTRGVFGTVSRIRLDDLAGAFGGETPKEQRQTQSALLGFFFQEAATKGQVANPVELNQLWREQAAALYSSDRRRGAGDKALREALAQAKEDLAQAKALEAEAQASQAELQKVKADLQNLAQGRKEAAARLEQAQKEAARSLLDARRQKLAAEMAQLMASGLVDEASAARVRELEAGGKAARRAAGESRSRAASQENKAKEILQGRDPQVWETELEQAQKDLAGLEARQADLLNRERNLAEQARNLGEEWKQDADQLAELPEELPLELDRCIQEMTQAEQRVRTAQAVLDAQEIPPQALYSLWMPGLVAMLAGLGLAGVSILSGMWDALAWAGLVLGILGAGASAAGRWARSRMGQYQILKQNLEIAANQVRSLEERLKSICSAAQIAPGTRPPVLAEALGKARAWKLGLEELDQARQSLDDELRGLAGRFGLEPDGGMHALSAAIREQQGHLGQARQAQAEGARHTEQAMAHERDANGADDDLKQLMAGAGVQSPEEFWQAADRARKVKELGVVKAELDEQLESEPGRGPAMHPQQAEELVKQARSSLAELDREAAQLEQNRGRLAESLKRLQEQPGAAQIAERLSSLEEERQALARRHDSLLLAGELLEQAMDQYRLEAQPSLLKRAGEYLEHMTHGAYARLVSDLFQTKSNQPPQLSARGGEGLAERQAEVLSRGTRDQLYLCLRLALADEITQDSESLPLILDDPLVNFDDARLKAALEMLSQVAKKRQVILLTCHGEQAGLLDGLPYTRLSLRN